MAGILASAIMRSQAEFVTAQPYPGPLREGRMPTGRELLQAARCFKRYGAERQHFFYTRQCRACQNLLSEV